LDTPRGGIVENRQKSIFHDFSKIGENRDFHDFSKKIDFFQKSTPPRIGAAAKIFCGDPLSTGSPNKKSQLSRPWLGSATFDLSKIGWPPPTEGLTAARPAPTAKYTRYTRPTA
jgi:hypothetical protein